MSTKELHDFMTDIGISYGLASVLCRIAQVELETKYQLSRSSECGAMEALGGFKQKSKADFTITLKHEDVIAQEMEELLASYPAK